MPKVDLKSLRISRGLTLKEVADHVGVSEATVSRWESGNIKNMRRDKIYKLAKILDVPGSYLCDDTEEIKKASDLSETKLELINIINGMSEEDAAAALRILRR